MKQNPSSEIKVGIFVTIVLALLMMVILVLSSKSTFFERTYRLETSFTNVAGLAEGAAVRLAGVDVGYVQSVRFSEDAERTRVFVTFTVDQDALLRITRDSRATIDTMGLLGKKYIELVPGEPSSGFVREGDSITGVDPVDFVRELQRAGEIIDNINTLSSSIREVVASIRGDGEATDLSRAITSLKNVIRGVEEGPGMAHALIFDESREAIVADVADAVGDLRGIVGDIREGEGTLHALIYGRGGREVVENLGAATEAIEELLVELRDGEGTLHRLIYGSERDEIVDELVATARNLREITGTIRAGEGTLGALVMDPSVYEDIKRITGGVERSRALKWLIRYTVRRQERRGESGEADAY